MTEEPVQSEPDPVAVLDALIAPGVRAALRHLVEENNGVEVFSIGTVGPSGAVEELEPIAFGNRDSVPAPAQDARPGQVLIHNHPGGNLTPSGADINLASLYGNSGIGFYIVDNACERVRVVVKPFKKPPPVPVNEDALAADFEPGGKLAAGTPGYEHRPQQVDMMRLVARAFNGGRIAMVEAGTGTGKSFAYLAPAIAWATANKRRVVISTNTINLQEQLIAKDLPALGERMGIPFRAVLVKGRSNYVSLRRLQYAADQAGLFESDRSRELRQLASWTRKTQDGSRSDLPFEVSDEVWEAVQSDKDDCMRARCPNFDSCFFYRSRRESAGADIVVANHHLVMADLAIKKDHTGNDFVAILPPYDRVVFDEAHHMEEIATEYFGSETSPFAIRRLLGKLASAREGRGVLHKLRDDVFRLDHRFLYPSTKQILDALEGQIFPAKSALDASLDHVFDQVFYKTLQFHQIAELKPREKRELRITATTTASDYWVELTDLLGTAGEEMERFLKPLERALGLLRFYPEELANELVNVRLNAAGLASKLSQHLGALRFFLKAGDEEYCRWIQVFYIRDRPAVRLCVAPLDVAPSLRKALFEKKRTAVLTSATMTVEKSFDFFARRLGLVAGPGDADRAEPPAPPPDDDENAGPPLADVAGRTDFLLLDSPFDFARSCLVGVVTDLAEPGHAAFTTSSHDAILDTLRLTGGRAFVLFTSYSAMERSYAALAGPLAREAITAMRQGQMPRTKLLEAFRTTPRCALFATSSFWEGVDVPGRALECLILARLPFRVPTNPILEARTERIDRLGGNSFMEMSIPLAVIHFKQGFGRLIRTRTDRGVVLILDHRVVTKHYGRAFLNSLPPARVFTGATGDVLAEFGQFLGRDQGR